ncbi:MAG: hypothetical protein M1820_001087 [Bogoriella megaspora]|nr:MAG: hypothetical protein M1820_001087 [Bogoriella megaspora]
MQKLDVASGSDWDVTIPISQTQVSSAAGYAPSTTTAWMTEIEWMTTTATAWKTPAATTVFVKQYESAEPTATQSPSFLSGTYREQPTMFPRPPPSSIGDSPRRQKGLSDGAEDVIIAFGSIGGTLLFIFLVYAFYQVRRGVPFNEILNFKQAWRSRRKPFPSARPSQRSISRPQRWDAEGSFATAEKMSTNSGPQKPRMVMIRNNSNPSSGSGRSKDIWQEKSSIPDAAERSFLHESAENPMNPFTNNPSSWPLRDQSRASSPIVPPVGSISQSEVSRNTREQTFTTGTFEQDPHGSYPNGLYQPTARRPGVGLNVSRFSWTETFSQEPPTPRFALERQSVATSSRSSLPRFRTVSSWVGNQTGRINSVLLRNQPGMQRIPDEESSISGRSDEETVRPPVPEIPQQPLYQAKSGRGKDAGQDANGNTHVQPVPMPEQKPQGNRQIRPATQTSDATVFRQHPGDKLPGPRASVIKTEDMSLRQSGSI